MNFLPEPYPHNRTHPDPPRSSELIPANPAVVMTRVTAPCPLATKRRRVGARHRVLRRDAYNRPLTIAYNRPLTILQGSPTT